MAAPISPVRIQGIRFTDMAAAQGAAVPHWGQKRDPRRISDPHLGQLGLPNGDPQLLQKLPLDWAPQDGQAEAPDIRNSLVTGEY
jgi:hypothetical protein